MAVTLAEAAGRASIMAAKPIAIVSGPHFWLGGGEGGSQLSGELYMETKPIIPDRLGKLKPMISL